MTRNHNPYNLTTSHQAALVRWDQAHRELQRQTRFLNKHVEREMKTRKTEDQLLELADSCPKRGYHGTRYVYDHIYRTFTAKAEAKPGQ